MIDLYFKIKHKNNNYYIKTAYYHDYIVRDINMISIHHTLKIQLN